MRRDQVSRGVSVRCRYAASGIRHKRSGIFTLSVKRSSLIIRLKSSLVTVSWVGVNQCLSMCHCCQQVELVSPKWDRTGRPAKMRREKGRNLTQSNEKSPFANRKLKKANWKHKTPPKNFDYTSQRLQTDLGQSVGVATATPTGVVTPVYGIPTFPLTAKLYKTFNMRDWESWGVAQILI